MMVYFALRNLLTVLEKFLLGYRCHIISGTPTMYLDMIRLSEQDGRPSHEGDVAVTGGGPLVPQLGRDIMKKLNIKRLHVSRLSSGIRSKTAPASISVS